MKIIIDGNFSRPICTILLLIGCGIGAVGFYKRSLLLMSVGLAVAAVGGYASKAKQVGIKPFDNSYQKARESYRTEGEENGESK